MKTVGESDRKVEVSGVSETVDMSIHADPRMFKNLLSSIYSDKEKTVIRELMANAFDAHVEAGVDREIEVHLPTRLDSTLIVRDFGVGMNHEFMMRLYSQLGKSTKANSNKQTGMFGVGSKSPLSITDTFTVKAYDQDKVRTYVVTIPANEHPQIHFAFDNKKEGAERGIEVIVPVDMSRRDAMLQGLSSQHFCWFDKKVKLLGAVDEVKHRFYSSIAKLGERLYIAQPSTHSTGNWNVFVRQGAAVYPLNEIQVRDFIKHDVADMIRTLCKGGRHVLVDLPLGTANVTMAREAIQYDKDSIKNIVKVTNEAFQEFQARVNTLVGKAKDYHSILPKITTILFPDPKDAAKLSCQRLAHGLLVFAAKRIDENYLEYYNKLPDIPNILHDGSAEVDKAGRTVMTRPAKEMPQKMFSINQPEFPEGKVILHGGQLYGRQQVHIGSAYSYCSFTSPQITFLIPNHLREWKQRIEDYCKTTFKDETFSDHQNEGVHISVVRAAKRNLADCKRVLKKHKITGEIVEVDELPNIATNEVRKRNFSKTSAYPFDFTGRGGWTEGKVEPDYAKPAYYCARVGISQECHLTHPAKEYVGKLKMQKKANNHNVKNILEDSYTRGILDKTWPVYRMTENQAAHVAATCPQWVHFPSVVTAHVEAQWKPDMHSAISASRIIHDCEMVKNFCQFLKQFQGKTNRTNDIAKFDIMFRLCKEPLFQMVAAVKYDYLENHLTYRTDQSLERLSRTLMEYGQDKIDRGFVDRLDKLVEAWNDRYKFACRMMNNSTYNNQADGWTMHLGWYLDSAIPFWYTEKVKVNLNNYPELEDQIKVLKKLLHTVQQDVYARDTARAVVEEEEPNVARRYAA